MHVIRSTSTQIAPSPHVSNDLRTSNAPRSLLQVVSCLTLDLTGYLLHSRSSPTVHWPLTSMAFDIELPKQYKACVYDAPGKVSTKVVELDVPEPGPGELLIQL